MDTIIDELFIPQMLQHGFMETAQSGRSGLLEFEYRESNGSGSFLIRPVNKDLAVSLADFTVRRPIELAWKQPEYFLIGLQRGNRWGNRWGNKWGLSTHIGKNDTFRQHCPGGFCNRGISISFLADFFDGFFGLRHGFSYGELERAVVDLNRFLPPPDAAVILKQIGEAASSADTGAAWIEAKTLELISVILDWHRRIGVRDQVQLTEQDKAGIAETLRYIGEHLSEPIGLETLAKMAAMSISKFTAIFRRHTGLSTTAYISRLRMETAMDMLKNTSLPIGEIAARTGYKHHASFSAAFLERFGIAPGVCRRGRR